LAGLRFGKGRRSFVGSRPASLGCVGAGLGLCAVPASRAPWAFCVSTVGDCPLRGPWRFAPDLRAPAPGLGCAVKGALPACRVL
jgi:hypothetical protein